VSKVFLGVLNEGFVGSTCIGSIFTCLCSGYSPSNQYANGCSGTDGNRFAGGDTVITSNQYANDCSGPDGNRFAGGDTIITRGV
jgi:hypothetical protein